MAVSHDLSVGLLYGLQKRAFWCVCFYPTIHSEKFGKILSTTRSSSAVIHRELTVTLPSGLVYKWIKLVISNCQFIKKRNHKMHTILSGLSCYLQDLE